MAPSIKSTEQSFLELCYRQPHCAKNMRAVELAYRYLENGKKLRPQINSVINLTNILVKFADEEKEL